MKCKEYIYSRKDDEHRQCSRKAVKDGWCKQHWLHPFYAIWHNRLDEEIDSLPKCPCKWGDIVSPATSSCMEDDDDETKIGEMALCCVDCETTTDYFPVSSEAQLSALLDAWRQAVSAKAVSL